MTNRIHFRYSNKVLGSRSGKLLRLASTLVCSVVLLLAHLSRWAASPHFAFSFPFLSLKKIKKSINPDFPLVGIDMTSHCQVLPVSGSDPLSADSVSHCKSAGRRRGRTKPRADMESISIPFYSFLYGIYCKWGEKSNKNLFSFRPFWAPPCSRACPTPPKSRRHFIAN